MHSFWNAPPAVLLLEVTQSWKTIGWTFPTNSFPLANRSNVDVHCLKVCVCVVLEFFRQWLTRYEWHSCFIIIFCFYLTFPLSSCDAPSFSSRIPYRISRAAARRFIPCLPLVLLQFLCCFSKLLHLIFRPAASFIAVISYTHTHIHDLWILVSPLDRYLNFQWLCFLLAKNSLISPCQIRGRFGCHFTLRYFIPGRALSIINSCGSACRIARTGPSGPAMLSLPLSPLLYLLTLFLFSHCRCHFRPSTRFSSLPSASFPFLSLGLTPSQLHPLASILTASFSSFCCVAPRNA